MGSEPDDTMKVSKLIPILKEYNELEAINTSVNRMKVQDAKLRHMLALFIEEAKRLRDRAATTSNKGPDRGWKLTHFLY